VLTGSTDRRVTGVYSGSVRRVLSRLLEGLDHLVLPAAGGVDVVILGPGLMRPSTKPVISASRAGTEQRRMIRSDDSGEPPAVQGWVPTQDPYAEARAAAAKATAGMRMTVAQASLPMEGSNNGVQGWVPTQDPYAEARAAAAKKAAATPMPPAQPSPVTSESDSGVQGWVPKQDPYAAARAAAIKDARDKEAKARQHKQPATDKPALRADALADQIRQATSFGDERPVDLGTRQEERSRGSALRPPSLTPGFAPFPQSQFGPRGDDP
jgi:hypothetical protein